MFLVSPLSIALGLTTAAVVVAFILSRLLEWILFQLGVGPRSARAAVPYFFVCFCAILALMTADKSAAVGATLIVLGVMALGGAIFRVSGSKAAASIVALFLLVSLSAEVVANNPAIFVNGRAIVKALWPSPAPPLAPATQEAVPPPAQVNARPSARLSDRLSAADGSLAVEPTSVPETPSTTRVTLRLGREVNTGWTWTSGLHVYVSEIHPKTADLEVSAGGGVWERLPHIEMDGERGYVRPEAKDIGAPIKFRAVDEEIQLTLVHLPAAQCPVVLPKQGWVIRKNEKVN